MKTRHKRPQKSRSRARSSAWQVLLVLFALGATLGLGVLATDQYVASKRRAAAEAAAAFVANSDEIYTGSILYMPNANMTDTCHQWLFDNRDGSLTDNGSVDCMRAAYRGLEPPKRLSVARAQVISSGFRDGVSDTKADH
jgi:hypothetical protein